MSSLLFPENLKAIGKSIAFGDTNFKVIRRWLSYARMVLRQVGQVWVEYEDYKVLDHGTKKTGELKCIHTKEHNTIQMPKNSNDRVIITACHFDWASAKFV